MTMLPIYHNNCKNKGNNNKAEKAATVTPAIMSV